VPFSCVLSLVLRHSTKGLIIFRALLASSKHRLSSPVSLIPPILNSIVSFFHQLKTLY
jgi:hypothetical protein